MAFSNAGKPMVKDTVSGSLCAASWALHTAADYLSTLSVLLAWEDLACHLHCIAREVVRLKALHSVYQERWRLGFPSAYRQAVFSYFLRS